MKRKVLVVLLAALMLVGLFAPMASGITALPDTHRAEITGIAANTNVTWRVAARYGAINPQYQIVIHNITTGVDVWVYGRTGHAGTQFNVASLVPAETLIPGNEYRIDVRATYSTATMGLVGQGPWDSLEFTFLPHYLARPPLVNNAEVDLINRDTLIASWRAPETTSLTNPGTGLATPAYEIVVQRVTGGPPYTYAEVARFTQNANATTFNFTQARWGAGTAAIDNPLTVGGWYQIAVRPLFARANNDVNENWIASSNFQFVPPAPTMGVVTSSGSLTTDATATATWGTTVSFPTYFRVVGQTARIYRYASPADVGVVTPTIVAYPPVSPTAWSVSPFHLHHYPVSTHLWAGFYHRIVIDTLLTDARTPGDALAATVSNHYDFRMPDRGIYITTTNLERPAVGTSFPRQYLEARPTMPIIGNEFVIVWSQYSRPSQGYTPPATGFVPVDPATGAVIVENRADYTHVDGWMRVRASLVRVSDGVVFAYASRDIQIGPATQQPQPGTFAITNAAATALNTSRALDTANAPAGQTVTWAITGRTHANDTTINTATGAITAGRVPGTVTIRATAGTGATAVQSAPVTITIGTPAQRPSEWALVDVAPAIHANLVPARLQTNQHYTRHITRAEFAELAVILFEAQRGPITGFNPLPFEDTTNQFVARAAHIDVVRGVSATRFEPDSLISREQAAAMLSRLAAALGRPIPNHTSTFADNAQISDWASAYVGQKQGSGVMVGVAGNRFDPHSRFTVEQSITTIMRIRDL